TKRSYAEDIVLSGVLGMASDVSQGKRAELVQDSYGKIAALANTVRDLAEMYRGIHTVIAELMPAENFYIALLDVETGMLAFPYFVDEFDSAPAPRPLGRGLTEYVLRNRALLATPEVFEDLIQRGEVVRVGSPSVDWMGVPLTTPQGTLGVLVVQSYSS